MISGVDLRTKGRADFEPFARRQAREGGPLVRERLEILQVNIGKLCNQACQHCHVNAGPWQTEANMDAAMVDHVLRFAAEADVGTVDVTGGAPELNPEFRRLVRSLREQGRHVIDRCNLTVLFEPGQEDLADFLAEHEVELVCSLPCYLEDNVDTQRGDGVFQKSIAALKLLNARGYGEGGDLTLTLVYNPVGAHLPPDQAKLEADYARELGERYGVTFDQLFTITNMPIQRFASDLRRQGRLDEYMDLLAHAYNPAAARGVMCRSLVSIGWDGAVYDCDFNQMLQLELRDQGAPLNLATLRPEDVLGRRVIVDDHCYGCTAGAGSSCGGTLV